MKIITIEKDDTNANINSLGYAYLVGKGVLKDYAKAKHLFKEVIKSGNVSTFSTFSAMNNLATMYKNGQGVTINYSKAKYLFKEAIKGGNVSAMINLGRMYMYGQVSLNYLKAKCLFDRALMNGSSVAINHLVLLFKLDKLDEQIVVDYILNIDPSKLKDIYNYDERYIAALVEINELKNEIIFLKNKLN
jgi:FOG: TPR repeat, SEL1 subfamily